MSRRARRRPSSSPAGPTRGTPSIRRALATAPVPCRPIRRQRDWLALVSDWLALTNARADGQRNARQLAAALVGYADWHTGTARPTWGRLQERSGLSRRTVARWLRRLHDAGLLVTVQSGTTPQFSPGVLTDPDAGNLAAMYLLTAPHAPAKAPESSAADKVGDEATSDEAANGRAVEESGTPSPSRSGGEQTPTHARKATGTNSRPNGRPGEKLIKERCHAGSRVLHRTWRCQQAVQLQDSALALRVLSPAHVAALIRPFLLAGWTVEDLRYGLDHHPDGRPHWHTAPVTAPAGWALSRLAHWRKPNGMVLPGRRAQLLSAADIHRQKLAEQQARLDPSISRAEARDAAQRGLAAVRTALAAAGIQVPAGMGQSART